MQTLHFFVTMTQSALTLPPSRHLTKETLELEIISKVNNKHTRTTPLASFWWLYC